MAVVAVHADFSRAGTVGASRSIWRRHVAGLAALLAVLIALVPLAPRVHRASTTVGDKFVSVVVREVASAGDAAQRAVRAGGGTIERRLGIINGFVARVRESAIARLQATPGVASVTTNGALHLAASSYSASQDPYSMSSVEQVIGSRVWNRTTGQGVDVALIDSGVAPVMGLSNPGQVVHGPDLTNESQTSGTANLDTFGHGTFMAGLIAGHDPGVDILSNSTNSSAYLGVAPNARVVSVKVADAHGMTDVSQVIAAIDWVVQHAHDPGMNIRVMNLSFGTDSSQPYQLDPLAFATEVAWRNGIVVVTSAGNSGATSGRLTMPALDPFVIAVGADDIMGSPSIQDDTIPSFSSRGDGVRNPDFVAPGTHLQGLRVPGSYVDTLFGATATFADRFFRGSGTSQAAAITSGAAALLLAQRPWLTPDQVKRLLVSTADPLPVADAQAQGAGLVNVGKAVSSATPTVVQQFTPSTGLGSLDASRGSLRISLRGTVLSGEQDIFGQPVNTASLAALEASGSSWSGGTWNGSTWTGSSWSGSCWTGSSWTGSTWSGNDWTGSSWSADNWASGTWTGSSWSGSTWSGSTWSGSTWSGSTWTGSSWSGSTWSGSTWSGSTWSGSSWSSAGWI
jgi:serine protease AprX